MHRPMAISFFSEGFRSSRTLSRASRTVKKAISTYMRIISIVLRPTRLSP